MSTKNIFTKGNSSSSNSRSRNVLFILKYPSTERTPDPEQKMLVSSSAVILTSNNIYSINSTQTESRKMKKKSATPFIILFFFFRHIKFIIHYLIWILWQFNRRILIGTIIFFFFFLIYLLKIHYLHLEGKIVNFVQIQKCIVS